MHSWSVIAPRRSRHPRTIDFGWSQAVVIAAHLCRWCGRLHTYVCGHECFHGSLHAFDPLPLVQPSPQLVMVCVFFLGRVRCKNGGGWGLRWAGTAMRESAFSEQADELPLLPLGRREGGSYCSGLLVLEICARVGETLL